jgi:ribosome-binding factor A
VAHHRQRVEEQVHRLVSRILLERLGDLRLPLLSVTGVRVSPDLRHARVAVSVLGPPEEAQRTLDVLRRASGRVRRALATQAGLRRVPELEFLIDEDVRREERVHELLSRLAGPEEE